MTDPRQPSTVTPYSLDLARRSILFNPPTASTSTSNETLSFFATMLSMVSVMLKIKFAGWMALVLVIMQVCNSRATTDEGSRAFTGISFAVMSIIMNYLPLFIGSPGEKQQQ